MGKMYRAISADTWVAECTHMAACEADWMPTPADLNMSREALGVQPHVDRPKPEVRGSEAIVETKVLMKEFLDFMRWMHHGVNTSGLHGSINSVDDAAAAIRRALNNGAPPIAKRTRIFYA